MDIVCRENTKLKNLLSEANEKNAEQKKEMERRDAAQLLSHVDFMEKKTYKELVRVLNTCRCCPRHMERKIKPEDFDKEEFVSFPHSDRSEEERAAEVGKCSCTCRQKTRRLYSKYYQTCILCEED